MIAATPDVFEDQIARLARAGFVAVGRSVRRLSGRCARARAFGADHLRRRLPEQLGPRASGAGARGMRAVLFIITGWIGDGPSGRMPAGRAAARHAGPRRLQAAGRRRPRRRGHAALERDRAMRAAGTFEFHSIPTHTRWDQNAPATSRPSAPASPTSCGCRARRWPAAWAASATTCAGRRAISTPTTWRRRARPASGTCTLPTLSARTRPARIPSTSTASRCAIAAAPGSTGASGCRATRSGVRATTPGKPGKAS